MLTQLGHISVQQFIAEYWQKKPLLIRQLISEPNPGFDANDLAGLAMEPDVESRIVYEELDGHPWQVQHGPFSEQQLTNLPANGWTLLVQSLDHWLPESADLLDLFRFIPNWQVDDIMASFAIPGGSVGPHYDHYDVFLLQTMGQRRWQIGPKCSQDSPHLPGTPLNILSDMNVIEEWVVEPGDCLYLPPGIAHHGVAINDSITLSVGFRSPDYQQLISSLADRLCEEPINQRHLAHNLSALQENPGEISRDILTQLQNHIQNQIADQIGFARWFGEFVSAPKNGASVLPLEEADQVSTATTANFIKDQFTVWRWNEGSRFTYSLCDSPTSDDCAEKLIIFSVDGDSQILPFNMLNWIQLLCASNRIDSKRLTELTSGCKQKIEILTNLINRGSLVVSPDYQ